MTVVTQASRLRAARCIRDRIGTDRQARARLRHDVRSRSPKLAVLLAGLDTAVVAETMQRDIAGELTRKDDVDASNPGRA